jgi:hypothetical protein
LNPVEREAVDELIPLAADTDIGVMGMKPFGGGAFLEKDSEIYKALEKYNKSVTDIFLRFELSFKVSSMLTGIRTIEQLEKNAVSGAEFRAYSSAEIESIIRDMDNLGREYENICHRCGYCLPCPQNINIPLFLRLDEYMKKYGSLSWPARMYRHHVPDALACVQCGRCEQKCPFNLPIMEMLRNAHKRLAM